MTREPLGLQTLLATNLVGPQVGVRRRRQRRWTFVLGLLGALTLPAAWAATASAGAIELARALPRRHRPGDTVHVAPGHCDRCGIVLSHHLDLARDDGYEVDLPSLSVVAMGRDRFATTGFGEPFAVSLFDRQGAVAGRIGRRGEGPGEMASPKQVAIGPGDSIYVLDRALRRIQVFSPSLAYVRMMAIPRINALGFGVLEDGTTIVAGQSSAGPSGRFGLHGLRAGAADPTPFGEAELGPANPGSAWLRRCLVPAAAGRGVWSARVNKYEVSLVDPAGRLATVYDVKTDWFPPWDTNQFPIYEPTRPTIIGVQVAGPSRLLIYIATTARGFRPAPRKQTRPGGEVVLPPLGDILKNFDTVVEVLDTSHGTIVARDVFDGYLLPAGRFPFAARVRDRPDGGRFIEVVRLTVS